MEPDPWKLRTLSAGGNACALHERNTATGEEWVVRVTATEADHPDLQVQLREALFPFVPAAEPVYETTFDHLEPRHRDAFLHMATCAKHYQEWREYHAAPAGGDAFALPQQRKLYVYRMAYAYMGDLKHFVRHQPWYVNERTWRRMTLFLYASLYAAQIKLGFDHNDLSFANIVVTWDERWGVFIPQLIDFDLSTLYDLDDDADASLYGVRDMGAYYTRAPEFFEYTNKTKAARRVRASGDIWSLGMVLLLRELGTHRERIDSPALVRDTSTYYNPWDRIGKLVFTDGSAANMNEAQAKYAIYHCSYALHATLMAVGFRDTAHTMYEDSYGEPEFEQGERLSLWPQRERKQIRQRIFEEIYEVYGHAIHTLGPEKLQFFSRTLHLNPWERTFYGHLYRYFELPYFTQSLQVDKWLQRYLEPMIGATKPWQKI
jgi:hypothetical protein